MRCVRSVNSALNHSEIGKDWTTDQLFQGKRMSLKFATLVGLLALTLAFLACARGQTTWPELSDAYDPVANSNSMVVSGNARFTVLTPNLIRMEYSPSGKFEDRATTAVLNRNLPVPKFDSSVSKDGKTLTISIASSQVSLVYQVGNGSRLH